MNVTVTAFASESEPAFYVGTGHYYEYVATSLTWSRLSPPPPRRGRWRAARATWSPSLRRRRTTSSSPSSMPTAGWEAPIASSKANGAGRMDPRPESSSGRVICQGVRIPTQTGEVGSRTTPHRTRTPLSSTPPAPGGTTCPTPGTPFPDTWSSAAGWVATHRQTSPPASRSRSTTCPLHLPMSPR